ncbi:PREDICTED: left-right determination factor 2 [Myotis davidii]|uniref:left-right determination factor 2 n=1 Tax=Myotis davidii TaxID=225400 RepID=UPI000767365B|nr:PREDICTED: left-right determination factor 2 [Myotis davidii]
MERRLPPNSELVQAVLRLFQEPVPEAALRRHQRLSPRSDLARVTIEWLHVRADGSNRTSLIDSRWGGCPGGGQGGRGEPAAPEGLSEGLIPRPCLPWCPAFHLSLSYQLVRLLGREQDRVSQESGSETRVCQDRFLDLGAGG